MLAKHKPIIIRALLLLCAIVMMLVIVIVFVKAGPLMACMMALTASASFSYSRLYFKYINPDTAYTEQSVKMRDKIIDMLQHDIEQHCETIRNMEKLIKQHDTEKDEQHARQT